MPTRRKLEASAIIPGKDTIFRHAKRRYLVPAVIALALIAYGAVVSSLNTRDNLRDTDRVTHTLEVLLGLDDVMRLMLNLETGQRGFVLTGDPAYLEPYDSSLPQVDGLLEKLTRLTRDNAAQQERIDLVRSLIDLRRESLARAIDARRNSGLEAAVQSILDGGGKVRMDELRALVDSMREEEIALLARRREKLDRSLRRTNLTVVLAGGAAIIAGITGTVLLALFLSARDREGELKLQKEKAEEADRAKSDFLAVMSHEIRTPMNSILGFGQLLHDSVESPRQKHYADALLTSGNSLLTLINDVLDMSKMEAGKTEFQPEIVIIRNFAEKIEILFAHRAAEKGLEYAVRVDSGVPPVLSFDAIRLRQILVNLIGNAIKFCREGSVLVSFRSEPAENGMVWLGAEVSDTGIGIPEDRKDDIFRPFYQIDSRQDRQFEGTGLGLSISRRLAEGMGGSILVESTPGLGSVFTLRVPVSIRHGLGEHPAPPSHEDARIPSPTPSRLTPSASPELVAALEQLHRNEWPDLVKLVPAQGTLNFAARLEDLARRHGCPPLAEHAARLMEAAGIMDFQEAGRLLRQFPALVADLRPSHD